MVKYTSNTLEKLEHLLEHVGYKIRYEKGNFKAGYCLINDKKVAIVNKFYAQESRINALIDMLVNLSIDTQLFDDKQLAFYNQIIKQHTSNQASNI